MGKIKELIKKTKEKNKGYNEIWEEYESLVDVLVNEFSIEYRVNKKEIKQNSYIAFRQLLDSFNLNKVNNGVKSAFTHYIKKYLPMRLKNFNNVNSLFSEPQNLRSLDLQKECESMSRDLRVDQIDDNFIKILDMDININKLSKREKEVYLLFKEGYDGGYIADMLGISVQRVYNCKQKIKKKLK